MPKTYVGGTVEVALAQKLRMWAKKYYRDNLSEALQSAIAHLDATLSKGEVPRYKMETEFHHRLEYEKAKP